MTPGRGGGNLSLALHQDGEHPVVLAFGLLKPVAGCEILTVTGISGARGSQRQGGEPQLQSREFHLSPQRLRPHPAAGQPACESILQSVATGFTSKLPAAEAMQHYPLDTAFERSLPAELAPAWAEWQAHRAA